MKGDSEHTTCCKYQKPWNPSILWLKFVSTLMFRNTPNIKLDSEKGAFHGKKTSVWATSSFLNVLYTYDILSPCILIKILTVFLSNTVRYVTHPYSTHFQFFKYICLYVWNCGTQNYPQSNLRTFIIGLNVFPYKFTDWKYHSC